MLCENCGKNEANVQYTEVINGVKKQMHLCEKCSEELGIGNINFNIPIDFSSFFGDFLEDYDNNFLPTFETKKELKCDKCGMTYEEFMNTGKFGCDNCYEVFTNRIDPILKNLHGANVHYGRKTLQSPENNVIRGEVKKQEKPKEEKENKLENLQNKLKQAIKDERYEEAAQIRDEIKKLN